MTEEKKPSVGAALLDILSKPQEQMEVGEIIEAYAHEYVKELESTVSSNFEKYASPFHIVVLHKKEAWSVNIVRNWFIARQTCPTMSTMWRDYPNHGHTIYQVNKGGAVEVAWSLPTRQEASVVVSNSQLYDPSLVKWCTEALSM